MNWAILCWLMIGQQFNGTASTAIRESEVTGMASQDTLRRRPSTRHRTTPRRPPRQPVPVPASVPRPDRDTVTHRYSGGAVSVVLHPFVHGKRTIILYDRKGNPTIDLQEVRQSYSVSYRLKFRSDGSVEHIEEHTNRGASMYWFTCGMTFSNNNEPEWRRCQQHPQRQVERPGSNDYYWHRQTKEWRKQEVSRENLPPPGGQRRR